MTAALPMGGQKITGMAEPTVSTDGATKNYVDTTTAAFFSTGDGKITLKTVADTGWILCDDGTFGSASSGASTRANADTQALFTLLFNNVADAYAPILTSGGGATTRAAQVSASAAWAANCRMSLTKQLGRAIAVAGTGSGLTGRSLGGALGGETSTLVTANLPAYTPAGSVGVSSTATVGSSTGFAGGGATQALVAINTGNQGNTTTAISISSSGSLTGTAQGGTSTPVSIMQPTTFWNVMVKL